MQSCKYEVVFSQSRAKAIVYDGVQVLLVTPPHSEEAACGFPGSNLRRRPLRESYIGLILKCREMSENIKHCEIEGVSTQRAYDEVNKEEQQRAINPTGRGPE